MTFSILALPIAELRGGLIANHGGRTGPTVRIGHLAGLEAGVSFGLGDLAGVGLILGPIMGRMSIPARVEFTTRLMPKMVLIMPTVVTLSI